MRHENKAVEEKRPKTPAYIVTFSDMVTLLLTFFVMLLSLASMQDPGLVNKGRDSFIESIRGLGLGLLFGKRPRPNLGSVKIKYFINSPDKLIEGRTIHAKEEQIRRVFNRLRQSVKTMPSQIAANKINFSVTNIRFPPGDTRLDESAKRFLTEFCLHLQQDSDSKPIKLYVLGLAADARTEKQQWILSAKRAQAVAKFLRNTLPSVLGSQTQRSALEPWSKWSVCSWGAGPGGDWVGQDSPISKQSQILIAVLRGSD